MFHVPRFYPEILSIQTGSSLGRLTPAVEKPWRRTDHYATYSRIVFAVIFDHLADNFDPLADNFDHLADKNVRETFLRSLMIYGVSQGFSTAVWHHKYQNKIEDLQNYL